jgi:phosphate transport system ATP-binding protein
MREAALEFVNFSAWWDSQRVLESIEFRIPRHTICAIIGASGSGKSTLLRSVNRLNDGLAGWRTDGEIRLGRASIQVISVTGLRRRIGMVFQKPIVFPRSIQDNVVFGLRYTATGKNRRFSEITESALRTVQLWDEVKNRLDDSALKLSVGQQQRLCLARTLVMEPEVLLLDEPTASLDSRSAGAIEETLVDLKSCCSILIVTHNLSQARRLGDLAAFVSAENGIGRLVEFGSADEVLSHPANPRTADYVGAQISPL